MTKLFFLVFSLMFALAFVACDNGDNGEDDADQVTTDVTTDVTPDVTTDVTTPDEDTEDVPDEDTAPVACKLEDTFFDAMPTDWSANFTMKMSGLINASDAEQIDQAFLVKMNANLNGTAYNLGSSGGYFLYSEDMVSDTEGNYYPAIVGVGMGNLTWPVSGKLASLWAGQTFVVVDDLKNWKEQAALEGYTGVQIDGTTQVAVFEVWLEVTSSAQYVRMECFRGLSAWKEDKSAFEGAMFVCVDQNTEWAVGETMKWMSYSKMVDDEAEMLAMVNEGVPEEEQRTDVCTCYTKDVDANGNPTTTMDCDEMKAEFGLGPKPDEDTVVPDETVDEGVTDDLLPDN